MPTAYVTAPREAAEGIAEALVERRLAACVNVVDCESVYRWEGAVVSDAEAILIAKTTADAYDALASTVDELHPYDVPCIERFDERDVAEPFAAWRSESVDPDRES
ncbi:divalent-cation tolerance protein CutA [Halorubrum sp. DTA98]|uniref:divalent-cation tolerance protein CutA n=1 Tax=Halorubrum sp. DTA98 TaxID=3402163 RepID=UPI003AB1026C